MTTVFETLTARCVAGRRVAAVLVATLLMTANASLARAQAADSNKWKFELTPYLWGAGMSGTVSVNDRPSDGLVVEQSFSDILNVLQFALMGSFEARKGRWGAFTDGVYFKVDDEGVLTGKE